MKKCAVGMAFAVAFAFMAAPRTQAQTESKTKIKTEKGNLVTYTGCVQTGGETRSYILEHVVPMRTVTETRGTSGTVVSSTTTYALVPGERVELQEFIGHKVEVTGVMIPAGKGDAKIETRTKTKQGTEEKTKTEVERGPYPQFRVTSVKHLADSCS